RAIDMIRREGRLEPLDDDFAERQQDPAPDALTRIAADEDARRIDRCLDTLDERPRAAIRLAYWQGMTQEELAQRLGAPVGTVKSWVRRGLIRLKECLDG
ncbi:MAG: sigma-70 family RNA polymerase sigma factor, partial [Alphaproteobacteria bacterium]|nr:sigma-70 family RNA polymerase sigma factor [Alphaproteobacteria bacterium]